MWHCKHAAEGRLYVASLLNAASSLGQTSSLWSAANIKRPSLLCYLRQVDSLAMLSDAKGQLTVESAPASGQETPVAAGSARS